MAAVAVFPVPSTSLEAASEMYVSLIDIPEADLPAYKLREQRYTFLFGCPATEVATGRVVENTIICLESSDEVYFRSFPEAPVREVYEGRLWGRTDIYPMRPYIQDCIDSAFKLGGVSALDNFLDGCLLSDRRHTVREYIDMFPGRICIPRAPSPVFDSNAFVDQAGSSATSPSSDLIFNSELPSLIDSLKSNVTDTPLLSRLIELSLHASDRLDMRLLGICSLLPPLLNSPDVKVLQLSLQLLSHLVVDRDIGYEVGLRGIHRLLIQLMTSPRYEDVSSDVDNCIHMITSNIPAGCTFPITDVDLSYLADPPKIKLFRLYDKDRNVDRIRRVRVREIRDHMPGHFATGYKLWGGAIVLARWVYENKDLFEGKRVLEIGSGLGLSGVAVSHTAASEITISDYLPAVLRNLRYNVSVNVDSGVLDRDIHQCACQVVKYDWDELLHDSEGHLVYTPSREEDVSNDFGPPAGKYDIVIGSDLVASVELAQRVGMSIQYFLKDDGIAVLASADGHSRFGMTEFPAVLQEMGFEFEVQPATASLLEGVEDVHTFNIYRVWRRS